MPSYQSLCLLSSSPQPRTSSLAATLTKKPSTMNYGRHGELTLRISLSFPLLFLPDDDYVGSFPRQCNDRHAMGTGPMVSSG